MKLIEKIKAEAKGITTMPELFRDEYGAYYTKQPPNTRPAVYSDFFDHNGNFIMNKPYLIHSEQNPNRWEAHRTKPGFQYANDFAIFLQKERIYVFEKK